MKAHIDKKVSDKGTVIYDNTSDLHRSIALSDLYYGDSSSVVSLFQNTGKSLLLQDVDVVDYERRLVAAEMYYDGEYIWSTAVDFNGLFRINIQTYKIEFIGQFPNENTEGYRLFCDIAEVNGKLYFCPYNAKNIAIYDKVSSVFITIPLEKNMRDVDKKFTSILAYGEYVYIQGSRVYTIAQIDTKTSEVAYINNWVKDIQWRKCEEFDYYIQRGCIHEGRLYYFSPVARCLLSIEPDDWSYKITPLEYKALSGVSKLISADGLLWLLPDGNSDGEISYVDLQTVKLTPLTKINAAINFCKVNECIYYFSVSGAQFYKVHTTSKEVTTFLIEKGVYASCAGGDKIYIMTRQSGELYIFNTISLAIQKVNLSLDRIQLPDVNYLRSIEGNQEFNQFARESGFMNLQNALDIIIDKDIQSQHLKNRNSGQSIYEHMKGLVL